jgi:hypothetical protein
VPEELQKLQQFGLVSSISGSAEVSDISRGVKVWGVNTFMSSYLSDSGRSGPHIWVCSSGSPSGRVHWLYLLTSW